MDVVGLSDEEWAARQGGLAGASLKATSGTLYKFIKNVLSASQRDVVADPCRARECHTRLSL